MVKRVKNIHTNIIERYVNRIDRLRKVSTVEPSIRNPYQISDGRAGSTVQRQTAKQRYARNVLLYVQTRWFFPQLVIFSTKGNLIFADWFVPQHLVLNFWIERSTCAGLNIVFLEEKSKIVFAEISRRLWTFAINGLLWGGGGFVNMQHLFVFVVVHYKQRLFRQMSFFLKHVCSYQNFVRL